MKPEQKGLRILFWMVLSVSVLTGILIVKEERTQVEGVDKVQEVAEVQQGEEGEKQEETKGGFAEYVEIMEYDEDKEELVKVDHKIPALEGPIPIWEKYTVAELFEPSGNPVVIYFTTINCPHCVRQTEVLEEYQKGGYEIRRLDKAIHSEIVESIGIQGYPTMMFMDSEGVIPEIGGREYEVEGIGTIPAFLGYKSVIEVSQVLDELK